MKSIILAALLLLLILAWCARREGFLPYPIAPISIVIQQNSQMMGKGKYPGSAAGPEPTSEVHWEELAAFNLQPPSRCQDEVDGDSEDDENLRHLTCWQTQDVPFFGGSLPNVHDTIWVASLRSETIWPRTGEHEYLYYTDSAYASYGACWLAAKRINTSLVCYPLKTDFSKFAKASWPKI
jgi:hypothetical protein